MLQGMESVVAAVCISRFDAMMEALEGGLWSLEGLCLEMSAVAPSF